MTKRIAIAEMEGVALDWAVAKAVCPDSFADSCREDGLPHWSEGWLSQGRPTADWSQCGPLIERHKVDIEHFKGEWRAEMWDESCAQYINMSDGLTPLIAACRAIVAAHNPSGFVEVPDELVEGE